MSDFEHNIKNFSSKLHTLIRQYQSVQKENEQISTELKTLKEKHQEQSEQIALLQQQIGILKASAGSMNEEEKKLFEKNINFYIREIEKCITTLSA